MPAPANWETAEADWVPHHRLDELDLLAAFRQALVRLDVLGGNGAP